MLKQSLHVDDLLSSLRVRVSERSIAGPGAGLSSTGGGGLGLGGGVRVRVREHGWHCVDRSGYESIGYGYSRHKLMAGVGKTQLK